jgi:hypothetical protein
MWLVSRTVRHGTCRLHRPLISYKCKVPSLDIWIWLTLLEIAHSLSLPIVDILLVVMRGSFLYSGLVASLSSAAFARHVTFPVTLTWEKGAPDGFEREMILMNGQFPGPTLSITEGDDVEFIVSNRLPYETTVHFHGVE